MITKVTQMNIKLTNKVVENTINDLEEVNKRREEYLKVMRS